MGPLVNHKFLVMFPNKIYVVLTTLFVGGETGKLDLMNNIAYLLAATAFAATPASAASLIVNAQGQLVGATGVDVNGTLFDVQLAASTEDTCTDLFGGCDEKSDFAFHTETDALAAASALLDQVLIDGPQGNFDSEIRLMTPGCLIRSLCVSVIRYLPVEGVKPFSVFAVNVIPTTKGDDFVSNTQIGGIENAFNFAIFRPTQIAAAVPEPATWAMMLLGFGFIGGAMRSRLRQKVIVSYARSLRTV